MQENLVVPASPVFIPLQQIMLTMPRTLITSVHLGDDTAAAAADSLVTIFMFQSKMRAAGHEDAVVVMDGEGREGRTHGDSKNEPAAD